MTEPLCEDEGCPHYGTPHVCVTRQWQCPVCSAWVDAGWWRHAHTRVKPFAARTMVQARQLGQDLTNADAEVTTYMRTGREPMRETP